MAAGYAWGLEPFTIPGAPASKFQVARVTVSPGAGGGREGVELGLAERLRVGEGVGEGEEPVEGEAEGVEEALSTSPESTTLSTLRFPVVPLKPEMAQQKPTLPPADAGNVAEKSSGDQVEFIERVLLFSPQGHSVAAESRE